jgi:hypothetical protein
VQAAKRTAEIRREVEGRLRQLREKFEDVESVVAIYSADKGTVDAAMNVLVSVLQALEDIVLYYSAKRGTCYNSIVVGISLLIESKRGADGRDGRMEKGRLQNRPHRVPERN